ncbi:site-specific integrase [Paraburkholderia youngii]|uniref:site-specific integrase n=1 Tax=Paraburkholderia youngii TaxID=2782701 RepID=UPI0015956162|nr:site-specific integrase [Paraburkholderia youngii]
MPKYTRIRPGHLLCEHWFEEAALRTHADAYVQYLIDRGYARETVECYFRCVAHFIHWMAQRGINLCDVSKSTIVQFLERHLPHCQCASRCRHTSADVRAGLKHFFAMLDGAQPEHLTLIVLTPIATELAEFKRHLAEVRGLSDSTCTVRVRQVHEFLVDRFGAGPVQISRLTPDDIVRFVMRRTNGLAPATIKGIGISLRSYLLFESSRGTPTETLIAALPRVAQWRLSGLPEVLSSVEVRQLLKAFDRSSATGMRDYAMTRCLLDLGLRRAEVARLSLDDIDWRDGTLTIHGKGKRIDIVPLPKLTGNAISEYLQYGRPNTARREVFVRHRPPLDAAANLDIVRNAVRYAAARCGLQQRVRGTHIFRHTMACRMAQGGVPFKEIGDLLRHRSLDTTTIYAKVNLPALRRVALPWPGKRS